MNPELKDKWIKALRSGYYKQGQEVLKSIDYKFCCLGVLCDIIDTNKWSLKTSLEAYTWESSDSLLPRSLQNELDLDSYVMIDLLQKDSEYQRYSLTMLNDQGMSFDQIADVIEYFL